MDGCAVLPPRWLGLPIEERVTVPVLRVGEVAQWFLDRLGLAADEDNLPVTVGLGRSHSGWYVTLQAWLNRRTAELVDARLVHSEELDPDEPDLEDGLVLYRVSKRELAGVGAR